jgi:hypothetical protein
MRIIFNPLLRKVNLDSCLHSIFGLDQITTLCLSWCRMSIDGVKSALREQVTKNRLEILVLGGIDREMNDADFLEICAFLPNLKQWNLLCPRSNLTIAGAREWKRICPHLEVVGAGGGFADEVKEAMHGLGVEVKELVEE